MKSFFKKVIILSVCIVLSFFLSFKYITKKELPYLKTTIGAAMIDKHNRLDSLPTPKIILVGGSNVMYGFNSQILEQNFKMPVQNMGMGASLGLSFILNEVKGSIKKNDVVILSLEYYLDEGDYNTKFYYEEVFPITQRYVEYPNKVEYYKSRVLYLLRKIRNFILINAFREHSKNDKVYDRYAFDKNGDIRRELRLKQKDSFQGKAPVKYRDYTVEIVKINTFIDKVTKVGAKVYFSFPCTMINQYKLNKNSYDMFYYQLKKGLHAPLINKPNDSIYPTVFFYDTMYHLCSPYHDIHTTKVAKALKKYLRN